MQPPRSRDGDKRRVEITIRTEINCAHVDGDECRGVAPAVHVRLVAGDVGVVDNGGVMDDGVEHGGRREERDVGLEHGGGRLRRRHGAVVAEVDALGEAEAVLDGSREILGHYEMREQCG